MVAGSTSVEPTHLRTSQNLPAWRAGKAGDQSTSWRAMSEIWVVDCPHRSLSTTWRTMQESLPSKCTFKEWNVLDREMIRSNPGFFACWIGKTFSSSDSTSPWQMWVQLLLGFRRFFRNKHNSTHIHIHSDIYSLSRKTTPYLSNDYLSFSFFFLF